MVRVTFYHKAGCWLCDTVEETLNGLRDKYGLAVVKMAIDTDEKLYALYRYDIPVLEFDDGTTLHGRIRKQKLLKALEANRE